MVELKGRALIIDVALELFSARGFDAVSIRDIAEATGLTNPALYRHFSSKQALGLSVYRSCYEDLLDRFEARRATADNPLEALLSHFDVVAEQLETDPRMFLYIERLQSVFWPQLRDSLGRRALTYQIKELIDSAQDSGLITSEVDVDVITALLLGSIGQRAEMIAQGLVTEEFAAEQLKLLFQSAVTPESVSS
ncbi:MAG: TetR/AcrR family transcriptional regulator [Pseudomonadota bacterium]